MNNRQKALVLVFTDLKYDMRVKRQIGFLGKTFDITVCCIDAASDAGYRVVKVPVAKPGLFRKGILTFVLLLRRFSWAHQIQYPFWDDMKKQLGNEHFDLIVANDVETLPFAFKLKKPGTKIIFDAHEYAPKHFEDRLWWRILFKPFNTFLCREYIPQTQGMITVSQSLADEYEKNFGKKPVVVTNAARYWDLQPLRTLPGTIKLVHQGTVGRSRRIELIIGMMKHLPAHFTLDLMLVSASGQNSEYMKELKALAANDPRIRFRDPVPNEKLVPALQEFDMGIILAPPINFNYIYGLPNKLYDYIQARIGVLTSPTLEIARKVNELNVGLVGDDFTSEGMARKLASLTEEDFYAFKVQAHKVAMEVSAERNEVIFDKLVEEVLSKN